MLSLQSLEHLFHRNVGAGIVERLTYLLAEVFGERLLLAVERAKAGSHYFARRGVFPRFHARLDALLEFAESNSDRF
jgi:hypothetical protein